MTEAELVQHCRDIRLLGLVWWGLMAAAGIGAIYFGCLYALGVKWRLPRARAAMKRLASDRDGHKYEREKLAVECARLRGKMEQVGKAAQAEINRVDRIREKTERGLVEAKAHIEALEAIMRAGGIVSPPPPPAIGRPSPSRAG